MKKLTLILFLFSISLGYGQETPQPTQATDWNSSRSNKTSKTTRVSNPDGNQNNNNNNNNMKIRQLGMIIERRPANGPNYYVSMPNKELTDFNKLPNQEKKIYFSDFIFRTIKRISPEEKIKKEDIMQATLAKWCGPCPLISARSGGGIIKIKKSDFIYKIYFSKGGKKDVEKVIITDKTEGTNDPSFAISPEDEDGGGFCYRPLNLNIDSTLEPMPVVQDEFCMDDSATQRVGNNKNDKAKYFFTKRIIKNNYETQSKDKGGPNQGKDINIGVAYGFSTPSSNFKDETYAGNGSYFELSGAYYFSKIGLGLSIGQISNPTDNNLTNFTGNLGFSVTNNTENIKSNYIGIGPEYKLKLNKFETTFQIRAGMYAVKSFAIGSDYTENTDVAVPFLSSKSEKTTNLGFISTGVKFDYNITNNLSLFASAGYLTALSDKLVVTESKVEDLNNNGIIDLADFKVADGSIKYSITEKNSTPSALNIGFGISYHFGNFSTKHQEDNITRKRPGRTKYSNITLKSDGNSENNNVQIVKNKVKEVIKKKEAVKNSINPQNPQDEDNTQNGRKKGYDYYKATSDNVKITGNSQEQEEIRRKAKYRCITPTRRGIFWENADGSYSCQTTVKKSQATIKIPSKLAGELASAKKLAIADKTQQGIIEITVVYPDKNKTVKVSIPSNKIQDTETILQTVIETTQGNGDKDKNGKVRVKYVAKL